MFSKTSLACPQLPQSSNRAVGWAWALGAKRPVTGRHRLGINIFPLAWGWVLHGFGELLPQGHPQKALELYSAS